MKLSRLYLAVGSLLLLAYLVVGATGMELGANQKERIPRDVRSSAGGYRSYHFWGVGK